MRAAGLLAWFWTVRGHMSEGRARLAGLLSMAESATPALRAEALRVAGSLALEQFDYSAARGLFVESLAIRRQLGHPADMLGALTGLGLTATQQGDHAIAQACFEEALAIQRALEDPVGIAESHTTWPIWLIRGHWSLQRVVAQIRELAAKPGSRRRPRQPGVVAHEQGERCHCPAPVRAELTINVAGAPRPGLSRPRGEVARDQENLDAAYLALARAWPWRRSGRPTRHCFVPTLRHVAAAQAADSALAGGRAGGARGGSRAAHAAALANIDAALRQRAKRERTIAAAMWQQGRV